MRQPNERARTVPGYTITSEGDVRHRQITLPSGIVLSAPVVVEKGKRGKPPKPVRTSSGRLLYALPDGNMVVDGTGIA